MPADASHRQAAARPRGAPPCVLVIFGATGDLTHRKLVPALLGLQRDRLLSDRFAVVGFARRDKDDDAFRADLAAACARHGRTDCADLAPLVERVFYHRSTFEDAAGYRALGDRLSRMDRELGTGGNRLFYLATPPSAYPTILAQLARAGLSRAAEGCWARAVVEKPFGTDLASARDLNAQVRAAFDERQVFRIDHYLGKETVQNILVLRFANRIFEPLWNEKYVDHVQITVAESIGVGSRAPYFERAGVLRDMIQNHLLQVLTLIAMEPPASLHPDAVRDEKVKVLRAIPTFDPAAVERHTVRGQYDAGIIDGEEVAAYRAEAGVDPLSQTETFAAVRLSVANWRWAKTPFLLRSGKRLPRRATEVAIHFRRPPHLLFGGERPMGRNVLVLRVQPDEGLRLQFSTKLPGPDVDLSDQSLEFDYGRSFGRPSPDAYERLLLDAMTGDSTLFARCDEVEEAWRIVDSIAAGWRSHGAAPLQYPAGSWGPAATSRLLRGGRRWREP